MTRGTVAGRGASDREFAGELYSFVEFRLVAPSDVAGGGAEVLGLACSAYEAVRTPKWAVSLPDGAEVLGSCPVEVFQTKTAQSRKSVRTIFPCRTRSR